MKFDAAARQFLLGEKFSTFETFPIAAPQSEIILRLDYVESLARGKKIVHVGFADHLPIIADRVRTNEWLHQRLMNVAERCIGVDIDREAMEYVQKEFGVPDLYLHNLETDAPLAEIVAERWDYMILGEIVEHLDNPVAFLSGIREKYEGYVERLVITVPNALRSNNVLRAFEQKEQINTDHRFWFTPYTLAKIAVRAGYQVEEFEFCANRRHPKWHWRWLQRKYPAFRDGLIMVLKV